MRVEPIERLDDPRVADYRNVRDADLRVASGAFLAEGRLNVGRLLASPRYRARSVFVTAAALRGIETSLARLSEETPIYLASQTLMNEIVGYRMHRGCLAAGERGCEPALEPLLAELAPGPRCVVVLEDVSNPDNVGGIFRNALAFGADAVVLTRRCADPLYRKALRVSMGATLRIPFARAADAPLVLRRLRKLGFTPLALSAQRSARPLTALTPVPERVALLLGAEGHGLSPPAAATAELCITIPMAAGIDSLNVATAAGIALHQLFQARAPGAAPGGAA
jgi:tRNA G18 (ribose-2'-O)-methylase SpoU